MRDALGGLVNIVIIVVFLVIVSGYLAFNVNYTKAFRVKNKIITAYEKYEGNCASPSSACAQEIKEYMNSLGYDISNPPRLTGQGYSCPSGMGYCYKEIPAYSEGASNSVTDVTNKYYYKIVTQVTIDIPIIRNIMAGVSIFEVRGDTKTITKRAG